MRRKIYKGGVDNYPLWWYGQSNRLQNFGDRPNYLVPHGPIFKGNGYYFDGDDDYMEDIYGRHLLREGTNGLWSQLYLTDSAPPPCGSAVGTGDALFLAYDQAPNITGSFILDPKYCPNLVILRCDYNHLSVVDVSQMTQLTTLVCNHGDLHALDVSNLINLVDLEFWTNYIHTIDISNLVNLTILKGSGNSLTALDVSNNLKLAYFYCWHCTLSTLDVSLNSAIHKLLCNNNSFDSAMVDKVLVDANNWGTSGGTLDISGNAAPSQTGIDAKNDMVNRNWTVTTD